MTKLVHRRRSRNGAVVGLAAVVLAVLIAQIAMAGGGSSATITISRTELKRLVDREVARELSATAAKKKSKRGPPGPSGPQGPAGPQGAQGTAGGAPACQGNGSGDVMVSAGAVCIDRYEVSVWSSPTGGTQYGASSDNYPCNDTGQGCQAGTPGQIYARSVAGATPSAFITWFQAQQALANVGKRLPTNAEWQQAVAGTPDSTACNVSTGTVASAGANAGCVSDFGANDMVGNLDEWVADWFPVGTACPGWFPNGTFSSDDTMCLAGASAATGPGALIRGGNYADGTDAGPFYAFPNFKPQDTNLSVGFRGAR